MALVVCARDPITFLLGWELMTLLPAVVILVGRGGDEPSRHTVFTYVAITHLGGAGTWIAVLLLAHAGAIGGSSAVESGSGLQIAIAFAALVGMGTKAGVMPLHVWLPRAHPIAPAPVSALMSGVMIKVGIYALIRVLVDWVGVLPLWLGVLVLGVGALSAVGGVSTRCSSTISSGCSRCTRSRTSGSSCSGSAPASFCALAALISGQRSRSGRRCCTR